MANYAKRWTPPAIAPSGNNVTPQMLVDWIAIMEDIDSNLLEAGLTRTETEGQLVIDEVDPYPTINTFAGFKEYLWGEDVIIRLDMGVGNDGAYSANNVNDHLRICNTPYIKVTITYDIGRGVNDSVEFYCPAQITSASTTVADNSIVSLGDLTCAVNTGDFFAIMYQCNSRGKVSISASGGGVTLGCYRGATLAFMLQRVDDGLVVINHNKSSASSTTNFINTTDTQLGSMVRFINGSLNTPIISDALGLQRTGAPNVAQIDGSGNVIFQQCFYRPTEQRTYKLLPDIISYNTNDVPDGTEVTLDIGGGTRNYICLGNGNTMGAYNHGTYSAFAIPFESI